jgi:hypothetical protein
VPLTSNGHKVFFGSLVGIMGYEYWLTALRNNLECSDSSAVVVATQSVSLRRMKKEDPTPTF